MSWRCSGVRCCALDLPPFNPPTRRLDGWRFESLTVSSASPMAISKTCFASWDGSRGRLATKPVCHRSAANLKLRHYRKLAAVGCFGKAQSFAITRRSRCGSVRGWPVESSHFSPGAAPQVGQRTASICSGVSGLFMPGKVCLKTYAQDGQFWTPCPVTASGLGGTLVHRE
jgi:hypothetical protein